MEKIKSEILLAHISKTLSQTCGMNVEPDTSVLSNGLLDSMGLMELIVSVQTEFNLKVDLAELKREEFDTPNLMVQFFLKHNY